MGLKTVEKPDWRFQMAQLAAASRSSGSGAAGAVGTPARRPSRPTGTLWGLDAHKLGWRDAISDPPSTSGRASGSTSGYTSLSDAAAGRGIDGAESPLLSPLSAVPFFGTSKGAWAHPSLEPTTPPRSPRRADAAPAEDGPHVGSCCLASDDVTSMPPRRMSMRRRTSISR